MPRALRKATPEPAVHLEPGRFAPAERRRLSAPGLRAFVAIADLWGLNEEQRRLILGYPSRSTYHNWVKAVREHRDITLDVDVLTRISAVLGIHQALGVLHAGEAEGVAWLRGPHRQPCSAESRRSSSSRAAPRTRSSPCGAFSTPRAAVSTWSRASWIGTSRPTRMRMSSSLDVHSAAPSPAHRLIPSRFPPVGLFDTVATAADLAAVMELAGWTNDRLVAHRIARLPEDEWVYGRPNSSIVMAAFLHVAPGGMRFNNSELGAWYASAALATAAVEVAHHLRREAAARSVVRVVRTYRAYACSLAGVLSRHPRPAGRSCGRLRFGQLRGIPAPGRNLFAPPEAPASSTTASGTSEA